jgi:hypothetical protein
MGKLTFVITFVVLLLLFGLVTYGSVYGFGVYNTNPSVRTGSVGGPIIIGGGPGSGK